MRGLRLFLGAASVLALAACGASPDQQQGPFSQAPPPPPAASGTCNADGAAAAVGHAYGEAVAEEARKNSGARVVRALRPGQAVTLEFSSERLTLDLDGAGRVTRARCG